MRLTNTIRDAFVRAALADVPQVDYTEQIRELVVKAATEILPPALRKALEEDPACKDHINSSYVCFGGATIIVPGTWGWNAKDKISDERKKQLDDLKSKRDKQDQTLSELGSKLQATAYAVTTRKALVELLPEFEKYLPEDKTTANRALPAVANVVSAFVEAGWPKQSAA